MAGSASPEAKTRYSERSRAAASPAASRAATNTDSIDGTKCAVVICSAAMISSRYAGSRCPSGLATTRRAPTCNGQKNSHTETSKVAGVFCRTVSDSSRSYSSCIHTRRFTIARCVITTPFGRPVEPEVKIM
ncbi:hypothetical protein NRB56_76210 [Nocardia sp. RB56]|uniref:Uncharacterized protein n=1 Tax=Nocardia aurantia TaxID=2585199 RepID=A0A7K0E2S1_9NOCA|nr:hypothetical protein [Nocardia aurantia]